MNRKIKGDGSWTKIQSFLKTSHQKVMDQITAFLFGEGRNLFNISKPSIKISTYTGQSVSCANSIEGNMLE